LLVIKLLVFDMKCDLLFLDLVLTKQVYHWPFKTVKGKFVDVLWRSLKIRRVKIIRISSRLLWEMTPIFADKCFKIMFNLGPLPKVPEWYADIG